MLGEEQNVVAMWAETGRGVNPSVNVYDYSVQRNPGSWETTSIKYDPKEELLWAGYSNGFLCSFHSSEREGGMLERYTCRKIAEGRVKCVMPCSLGVLAVHARGIQLFSRGLMSKAKYACGSLEKEDSGKGSNSAGSQGGGREFCCSAFNAPFMAMTDDVDSMTHITVGGGNMLDQLDIQSGLRKTSSVAIPNGSIVKSMSCGAMLAAGCEDGRVMMFDATLRHRKPQGIVVAHDGPVVSISCSPGDGYLVATVGQSAKSLNPYDKNAPCTYSCDPAIQVFDVRMMTARVPLRFPGFLIDPSAIAFTPDATLAVGGKSGDLVLRSSGGYDFDLSGRDTQDEFHITVDVSTRMRDGITDIDISSSSARLAVSCVSGTVVQYTSIPLAQTGDIFVNLESTPILIPEFPPPRAPVNVLPYDPSPFGSKYVARQTMGQYYSTGPLSSSMLNTPWIGSQMLQRVPARQICTSITSVAEERGGIKTAAMPTPSYPPNSLIYGVGKKLYAQCDPRNSDTASAPSSSSSGPSSSANRGKGQKGTTEYDIPEKYRKMNSHLTEKARINGLCFSEHNKTSFVGLQNFMPNAYMNAIIQLLYFVDPLKHAVLQEQYNTRHTHPAALSTTTGLACEFGMLYHQFQLIQKLLTCTMNPTILKCIPSTNVISIIKNMPEVSALGLLVDAPSQGPVPPSLPQRLETFHRFLLTELNRDLATASPVDALYGYTVRSVNTSAQHVSAMAEGEGEGRFSRALVVEIATIQDLQSSNSISPSPSTTTKPSGGGITATTTTSCFFSDLLCRSLFRNSLSRAWSSQLSEFVRVKQQRTVETLPQFLSLHCGGAVHNPPTLSLFRGKNARGGPWLPEEIIVDVWKTSALESHLVVRERLDLPRGWTSSIVSGEEGGDEKLPDGVYKDSGTGDLWYHSKMETEGTTAEDLKERQLQQEQQQKHCDDGDDREKEEEKKAVCTRKYLLHAVVSRVRGEAITNGSSLSTTTTTNYDEEEHAVLHVRLPQLKGGEEKGCVDEDDSPWLIVNDYLLEYTVLEDARSFEIPWKDPCILLYRCCETGEIEKSPLDHNFVTDEGSESTADYDVVPPCPPPPSTSCISSSIFEIPSLGSSRRVFSGIQRFMSNGLPQKSDIVAIDTEYLALSVEESELNKDGTRRLSRSARMSPARLSIIDARTNSVLVDDFIVQTQPVVDYLTRFSGIKREDLDPSTSQHHLASTRTVCLKLRYLIDAGCVFVGHDLANDFGVLNVTVPPDQIQDTVFLWRYKKWRKMSLRFLAYYLLKQDIQGETHDSVEDARVALALYLYHEKCKHDGTLRKTINNLYEHGNKVDFKARSTKRQ